MREIKTTIIITLFLLGIVSCYKRVDKKNIPTTGKGIWTALYDIEYVDTSYTYYENGDTNIIINMDYLAKIYIRSDGKKDTTYKLIDYDIEIRTNPFVYVCLKPIFYRRILKDEMDYIGCIANKLLEYLRLSELEQHYYYVCGERVFEMRLFFVPIKED